MTHQVIVDNVPWFGGGGEAGRLIQDRAVRDALLSGNYLRHCHAFVFHFRGLYFPVHCSLSLFFSFFKFILHFREMISQ